MIDNLEAFLLWKIEEGMLHNVLIALGNTYWFKLGMITKQQYTWEWKGICQRNLKNTLRDQSQQTKIVIASKLWFDLYIW